jgi:hypothetical protein
MANRVYYDRKRAEGKKHNAALICLARRRVDVLHAMLRTKTPYQPKRADEPRLAVSDPVEPCGRRRADQRLAG